VGRFPQPVAGWFAKLSARLFGLAKWPSGDAASIDETPDGHPSVDSPSLVNVTAETLSAAGHTVIHSDLYGMKWKAVCVVRLPA
jgi:hypothetical protein